MRKRFYSMAVLTLLVALPAGEASAQARRGAIRLDMGTPFVGLDYFPDRGDPNVQFGLWFADANALARPGLVMGVGYMPIDELIFGGRLGFGVISVPAGGLLGSVTTGLFSLQPFLEYLFLQGNVRPYVGIEGGFQLLMPERSDVLVHGRVVGIGGVHLFATEGFSITPGAAFGFVHNGPTRAAGMELLITLSLGGWVPTS